MQINNYQNAKEIKNPHEIQKAVKLRDDDTAKIIEMSLKPGDVVKEHTTPVDVTFFVHEGEVEMEIGSEKEKVAKGDLILSPKNIPHGFVNTGDVDARVLVIKHI
jgi:quercetin dioxygenase-like cupin family protein